MPSFFFVYCRSYGYDFNDEVNMPAPASPVFETGPKDSVSVVNVYNTSSPEVRNSLARKFTSFGSRLSDVFSATGKALNKFSMELASGEIDVPAATERVQKALGGSRGDFLSIATATQQSILAELTGVEPGTNYVGQATEFHDSLSIALGEGDRVFNGDSTNAQSILNFVSQLTGNPVFKALDMGAEAALLKGTLEVVSAWGVPELIDDLLKKQKPEVSYAVVSRAAKQLAGSADIDTIEKYIDLGYASALTNQVPDFAYILIRRYTFPRGTTREQWDSRLIQLLKVMNALHPNWDKAQRGTTIDEFDNIVPRMVTSLAMLTNISEDAHKLLMLSSEHRDAVMCAKHYPSSTFSRLARMFYPRIGLVD